MRSAVAPRPDPAAEIATVETRWFESLRPRVLAGNAVELLESGARFFPALEAEIDAARREVLLETYIWADDAAGRRIAEALARAAARGVDVRVVIDGYGTGTVPGEAGAILARSAVRVEVFRPERRRFALDRQRLRRLHRKLAVVDGRVGFVGGINLLDDHNDPNHGALGAPRLDFAVRVRGPVVVPLHLAAHRLAWELQVINRTLRATLRGAAERPPLPESIRSDARPAGPLRAALVLRDNVRLRHAIEKSYLEAIGAARRDVLIASAYFLPGRRLRRALLEAARRGVRVRLLLQGRVEYAVPHLATQSLYDGLLAGGIEILEYRPSFLHAKVAVVDDWATVGSSNIDPFSLLLAREANVVVHDAGFAAALRARLDAVIAQDAVAVSAEHVRARPMWQRFRHAAAVLLVRIGVAITGSGGRF